MLIHSLKLLASSKHPRFTWLSNSDFSTANASNNHSSFEFENESTSIQLNSYLRMRLMDYSTTAQSTHSCVQCGEAAISVCAACRDSPEGENEQVNSIWYCGVQCQTDAWSDHKLHCKALAARKTLYRAADTAQVYS